MGGPSVKQCAEHSLDGVQLVDIQRRGGAAHDSFAYAARQPRPTTDSESGDGSSPDPSARSSVRGYGNGRWPCSTIHVASDEHSACWRRTGKGRGIRSEIPWRLDDSLSSAASHDEFDDGPLAGPANFDRGSDRRIGYAADAIACDKGEVRARSPIARGARCQRNAWLSTRCVHGNGRG